MAEGRRVTRGRLAAVLVGLGDGRDGLHGRCAVAGELPGNERADRVRRRGRQRLRRQPDQPGADAGHEHRRTSPHVDLQRGGQQARRVDRRPGSCCSTRWPARPSRPSRTRRAATTRPSLQPGRDQARRSQHGGSGPSSTIDVAGTNRTTITTPTARPARLVAGRHVHRLRQHAGADDDPADQPDGRQRRDARDDGPGRRRCAASRLLRRRRSRRTARRSRTRSSAPATASPR